MLTLLKPVTWFPPMWAFGCGLVSAGRPVAEWWALAPLGVLLTGPLVCAASQAVNDWFDRDVDAINEPHRPIPSGRIPGHWGLGIAIAWSLLPLLVALPLGAWGVGATVVALLFAWGYSAPPFRFKRNGWLGAAVCGFTYEGLAWVTGAAVALGGAAPRAEILVAAALYSLGAHGIMTLNDFKAIEGDRRVGIASLPVQLGPERAALVACAVMLLAQLAVVVALFAWDRPAHGAAVLALVLLQVPCMRKWMRDPRGLAPWYNGTGVTLFVSGMMVTAAGLRIFGGAS